MKIKWEHFDAEFDDITNQWVDSEEEDEEFDEDMPDEFLEQLMQRQAPRQMISTPWGMFQVNDPFIPFKRFELRVGYTDFNVGEKFLQVVSETDGVELVKAISRYSFIIGIGRMFSFKDVRISIEQAVGLHSKEVPDEVSELKKKLSLQTDKKWLIYVYPNGQYEVTTNDEPEFENRVKELTEEKGKSNGVIFKNV